MRAPRVSVARDALRPIGGGGGGGGRGRPGPSMFGRARQDVRIYTCVCALGCVGVRASACGACACVRACVRPCVRAFMRAPLSARCARPIEIHSDFSSSPMREESGYVDEEEIVCPEQNASVMEHTVYN